MNLILEFQAMSREDYPQDDVSQLLDLLQQGIFAQKSHTPRLGLTSALLLGLQARLKYPRMSVSNSRNFGLQILVIA